MENKFVSLCLLAYKRPEQLKSCIETIRATADLPHEIIVNLDGDDSGNSEFLFQLYKQKLISKLIFNSGNNRGVGRSFANCVGVSEGDFIFKVDTDLTFEHNWLSVATKILQDNSDVGAVSLFDYRNYDPNDNRFNVLEERPDCKIVDDFVSSIYGFRKEDLIVPGWNVDDGYHMALRGHRSKLAITKRDYVHNSGFGVGKSTYVSGTIEAPFKTPTHASPLVYRSGIDF